MKTRLLLLLFIISSLFVKAQTIELSGIQSGVLDYDTIFVTGDVQVIENTVLWIEPGTTVIFNGFYSINVDGGFEAVGSETDSIRFTVNDTTGFHIPDVGDGGWNGLVFDKCTDPVILAYCKFSYGKAVEEPRAGGAVRIFGVNDVIINHCTFEHNFTRKRGGALFAEHSSLSINDCNIGENIGYNYEGDIYMWGAGFSFLNCTVNMKDMYFHDNECGSCYGGGVAFDSCEVNLDRAVFEDNFGVNGGGIGLQRSNHLKVNMSNVLLNNNGAFHYGGGMAINASAPLIQNFSIVDNYCVGAGGGGLQIYGEAHPVFTNCIIWGNEWRIEEPGEDKGFDGSQIWIWNYASKIDFHYSVLQFGIKEIHNHDSVLVYESMLETDPLFIDTIQRNYQLRAESPCRDSGTPDTTGLFLPEYDLIGNPRIYNNRIDRGAYEFFCVSVNEMQDTETNLKIIPNPLNENSVCEIILQRQTDVTMKIYSVTGALVFEKNLGLMNAGKQKISLSDFVNDNSKNQRMYMLEICTSEKSWKTKVVF